MSTLHQISLRTYRHEKLSSKNGNGTELEQIVHTHGTSCLIGWARGLNLNRHRWIFTSVSVVSNARFYLLIYFCCVPKTCSHCEEEWQKPVLWRSTFKISILICEQKPYQVWFSFLRKRYPVECEPFSSPEPVVSWSQQIKPSGTGDENECEHNLAPEQALFVAFFSGERGQARGDRGAIHARIALSLFAWKPPQNNACSVCYWTRSS